MQSAQLNFSRSDPAIRIEVDANTERRMRFGGSLLYAITYRCQFM
jgi:hypothetical protein